MTAVAHDRLRNDSARQQLVEFLKACRARVAPTEVGLPDTRRRRTPGLRREDVAALAGVSVTWYTWLEQGRAIQVSAAVLERIASTLRMSGDEREYLFALVQHRPPPPVAARADQVSTALRRLLDALDVPALVITAHWDILAFNDLAAKIFRHRGESPGGRNLLKLLLVDDAGYRHDPVAYEAMVRRVLARFRLDYGQALGDPVFEALVAELAARCPLFERLWNGTADVQTSFEGVIRHSQLGGLTLEHSAYVPEGSPTLRVVAFVPTDAPSAAKLAAVRGERPAAEPAAP